MGWRTRNIATALVFLLSIASYGQNETWIPKWKETFRQKKTRIEYLTKFILGNTAKLYLMDQGNRISDGYLGGIQGEKEGSFEGDLAHIAELGDVPGIILSSSALKNVMEHQKDINNYLDRTEKVVAENTDVLSVESRSVYMGLVDGLREKALLDMDELEMVVLKNDLKFRHNERLERIGAMEGELAHKRAFARMLFERAVLEVEYIRNEIRNINETEQYYGND